MKKLRLEELRVATFATTPELQGARGTVRGNEATGDCSIDFCSHGCMSAADSGCNGPSVGGQCQSYAYNPCYPSFYGCLTM